MIENSGLFFYDYIHFTTSKNLALKYTLDFGGSEYLGTILMMVEELDRLFEGRGSKLLDDYQKIKDYAGKSKEPIVIVWHKPELSKLGWEENFNGVQDTLKLMAEMPIIGTFEYHAEVLWQQLYFLLAANLNSQDYSIENP